MAQGRYELVGHFTQRMVERHVTMDDVRRVVAHARRIDPYPAVPARGGTAWRLHGRDLDGRYVAVGAEAYADEEGHAALLITVIVMENHR